MTDSSRLDNHGRLTRRTVLKGIGGAALAPAFPFPALAAEDVKATFAYGSIGYIWSVVHIAQKTDAWKVAGLDLESIDFPTGRAAMQALLAGSADFATATDTPVVFAALRGLRPIVLASYSRYSLDMKVTVRKDRGIDPAMPASLKGKRIGTTLGTSGQYMLDRYLEMAGLTMSDIEVINMKPADLVTSTATGELDGFAWTSRAARLADKQSEGMTATMVQDGFEQYFQSHQLLLTNETVVNERPEVLQPAVAAMLAAEDYIGNNPDWPELITERTRTPADEIRKAISAYEFQVRFDQRFLDDMVAEAEWAIRSGQVPSPGGDLKALMRGLVHDAPLKGLRPDRVTI